MTKDVKAVWKQVCDTILPHNPGWIKLLLDWKDAEQSDLKEALSACQLQNETNQAALERMQRQRDLLLQAVAELIPFAKSEKLTSHKSFDRSKPFTRQSVVEFARAAVLETNVEVPGIEPGPDKSASETGAYSHAAGYQD